MLVDPSSTGQGGSGAFAAGLDRWPFVVIFPEIHNASHSVGLSSKWLLRLLTGGEGGRHGDAAAEAPAGPGDAAAALPLVALLAAVDRFLPLPPLSKTGGPRQQGPSASASDCDDPEARERIVAHLAAVVLLQDAAEQCRAGKSFCWGGVDSGDPEVKERLITVR